MIVKKYKIYSDLTNELVGNIYLNDNGKYTMENLVQNGAKPSLFRLREDLWKDPERVHMIAEDWLNRRVVPRNRVGLMPLLKEIYGIDYYDRDFLITKNKGRIVTDCYRVEIED